MNKLTPELVSLVHHVELHQVGWWDQAIQQLIVGVTWLAGSVPSDDALKSQLEEHTAFSLDPNSIAVQVESLCNEGRLIRQPNGALQLSLDETNKIEAATRESENVEAEVRDHFLALVVQECPGIDTTNIWDTFVDQLIIPLTIEMGARTYELVSGTTSIDSDGSPRLQGYLSNFPDEQQKCLRRTIVKFLDPSNRPVRTWVLSHLNARFFIEATQLSAATLESLSKLTASPPRFDLFVDTNFLFSVLGMHENPSNEAAQSLLQLIDKVSGRVTLKKYVFPLTVDETRRVIAALQAELGKLRLTPNLAQAALDAEISGFARKLAEETLRSGKPLKPADFFGPYNTGLIQVFRSRGVEFFNENVDKYKTDQRVVDDLTDQLEYEKRRGITRAKTYEQLEHDMVLWHFVHDRRPNRIESPVEANSWVVTVDFRFLGFDAYKRRVTGEDIPICVHPTTLVQMLQFWVPRSELLEQTLLQSFRLPFLFRDFDPEAEKLTIKILETLGRFEAVGDLPVETVASLLMSRALRQKLTGSREIDEEISLVRDAIVQELRQVHNELQTSRADATSSREVLSVKEVELQELMNTISEQAERLKETEAQLGVEKESRKALEERLQKLEDQSSTKVRDASHRAERRRFLLKWIAAEVLAVPLLSVAVVSAVGDISHVDPRQAFAAALLLLTLGLLVWVDRSASKTETLRTSPIYIRFHQFRTWIFGILGVLVLGVTANAIWEYIKAEMK